MKNRSIPLPLSVAVVVVLCLVAWTPAVGEEPPRTPWGDPDLGGIWDFRTITPLERPSALAGKVFLSDEEAADFDEGAESKPNLRRH